MFQATGLSSQSKGHPSCTPMEGLKTGMAQALQSIASEGWLPLAAAMVGTSDKPPFGQILGYAPW